MSDFKLVLKGFSSKEAHELAERLKAVDEVEDARAAFKTHDHAFNPNDIQIMASIPPIEIVIHLGVAGMKLMGGGIALAAGNHLYKKVGEGLIDKIWEYMAAKCSGKSVVEVESVLYGPDGKPLKMMKSKR